MVQKLATESEKWGVSTAEKEFNDFYSYWNESYFHHVTVMNNFVHIKLAIGLLRILNYM